MGKDRIFNQKAKSKVELKIHYICSIKLGIMETIRLEFQPQIKAKIMELLSSFSSDELKIVQENLEFEAEKKMLQSRIDKINDGTAQYSTFEELDILLEETISKYED